MSSPEALFSSFKKPTTIADLPPKIITSIYKQFDELSSIAAFNSTCRKHYLIWKFNAGPISSAVIYDKLNSFSTALELLYIQEKVRGLDFATDPSPTDRLLEIQQEARDAVFRDRKGGYLGTSMSDSAYPTTLVRNKALVSNAIKVYHAGKLDTWAIWPRGIVLHDILPRLSFERFTSALYRIWILKTLILDETMDQW